MPVPDATLPSGDGAMTTLREAYDATKRMKVPQYRDGDCEVRRIWDEAAGKVLGVNADKLREWRRMLAAEPAASKKQ